MEKFDISGFLTFGDKLLITERIVITFMETYKKIHTSNNGLFYLLSGEWGEDVCPFDYKKEPYEFLIDAYNSKLENTRQKTAKQLFSQSYENKLFVARSNPNYHLITYDEAYEKLGTFIKISDEDYDFIKSFMFLMTDNGFKAKETSERLLRFFNDEIVKMELDYMDKTTGELSQRLLLLSYMFRFKKVKYDNCFNEQICNNIEKVRKYNLDDKLAFNTRVETNNSLFSRTFGYTFNTMMDEILFEIYCFINNNATIKQCKNCGKLFQPLRNDALYCDNISPQEETKTCKEYGAYQKWITNIKSDETTKLYRKIYMRKQMQAKRNPDIKMYVDDFENYKKQTKKWKENIKKGKKTNDEFLDWLKNLK